MARAAYETSGLLFHIEKRVSKAIESKTLGDVDQFLLQALLGVKDQSVLARTKGNELPVAVNVLTSITAHLEKLYPSLVGQYAMLCEFTHPNQLGGLLAYGDPISSSQLNLVSKPNHATPVYPVLSVALKLFEHRYNRLAELFADFVELCSKDAPRAANPPEPK